MAERQHPTGKASERSKGVNRHATMEKHGTEHAKVVGKKGPKHADVTDDRVTVRHFEVIGETLRRGVEKAGSKSAEHIAKAEEREVLESILDDIVDLFGELGDPIKSELDAHALLHRGLPRSALSNLIGNLQVIPVDEATEALGMSLRTLQRHKSTPVELLDVQQSGRAWKFAEILAKAARVLGSQDEAEQWLRRPAIGLDQQRPIDLLTTPAGVGLVEDYLGRLEYNVYT